MADQKSFVFEAAPRSQGGQAGRARSEPKASKVYSDRKPSEVHRASRKRVKKKPARKKAAARKAGAVKARVVKKTARRVPAKKKASRRS